MAITLDGTTGITTPALDSSGDVNLGDNVKANFGAGSDLQIYHDGTHSYIDDAGTGSLYVRASTNILLQNADGTKNYARFLEDGYSRLFHNNVLTLETTATGIDVTGDITPTGGVYLGGTGAANYLDDVETGTWAPTVNAGSVVTLTGSYVKIGKMVTLQCTGQDFSNHTSTNNIAISGAPFTNGTTHSVGTLMTRYFGGANNGGLITYMGTSSTDVQFYQSGTGTWNRMNFSEYTSVWDAYFTITYFTA
tara:strand:+ start:191 stop:940 length:750 start_codon:yes stop_codon:yes gene_type:complete